MTSIEEFISDLLNTMDPAARGEFREPERICLKLSLQKCGLTKYPPLVGPASGEIASGEMTCETCGQLYFAHPSDWRVIGYGNVPFLNVLCDGRRVKL